jgi:hypothetical protein
MKKVGALCLENFPESCQRGDRVEQRFSAASTAFICCKVFSPPRRQRAENPNFGGAVLTRA